MKKYYIRYYKDFANTYNLCWGSKEQEKEIINAGYERITRKEAIAKCTNERRMRKVDPAFSGWGDINILPFGWEKGYCNLYYLETDDGYIYY